MTLLYRALSLLSIAGLVAQAGCDDSPAHKKVAPSPTASQAEAPPAPKPTPAPGPPALVIDTISPKVGFERALLQYPDGRAKLADALSKQRAQLQGQALELSVDRKTNWAWVATFLDELSKIDVPRVSLRTETRSEFAAQTPFTPEARAGKAPGCSPVVMILADRSTAVWKLTGGAAGRRPKGMAGPDLSMTADSVERVAKACKNSGWLFVSAAPEVEWGLVYDLAASTKNIASVRFDSIVLLSTAPVPGHPVKLGS